MGKVGMVDFIEDNYALTAVVSPVFEPAWDERAWNICMCREETYFERRT